MGDIDNRRYFQYLRGGVLSLKLLPTFTDQCDLKNEDPLKNEDEVRKNDFGQNDKKNWLDKAKDRWKTSRNDDKLKEKRRKEDDLVEDDIVSS